MLRTHVVPYSDLDVGVGVCVCIKSPPSEDLLSDAADKDDYRTKLTKDNLIIVQRRHGTESAINIVLRRRNSLVRTKSTN